MVDEFFSFFYTTLIGKVYKDGKRWKLPKYYQSFYLNDMFSIHVFANVCFLGNLEGCVGLGYEDYKITGLGYWMNSPPTRHINGSLSIISPAPVRPGLVRTPPNITIAIKQLNILEFV